MQTEMQNANREEDHKTTLMKVSSPVTLQTGRDSVKTLPFREMDTVQQQLSVFFPDS